MIHKSNEVINSNGVKVRKSSNDCFRLVGSTILKGDPNSTTISKKPVVELDKSLLEKECSMQELKDTLLTKVLNGEFTEEEILILYESTFSYDNNYNYTVGQFFVYNSTLYEVIKDHTSDISIAPSEREDLYTKVIALDDVLSM